MRETRQPCGVPMGVACEGMRNYRKEMEKVVLNWKELWEAGKGGREPMVWDAE